MNPGNPNEYDQTTTAKPKSHPHLRSAGPPPPVTLPPPPPAPQAIEVGTAKAKPHTLPNINNLSFSMASRIKLGKFSGEAGERLDTWLNDFNGFCSVGNISGAGKKASLIRFYLHGPALAYFHSLKKAKKTDFTKVCDNFKKQFTFDTNTKLWDLKQNMGETCASYFMRVLTVSNYREYPQEMLVSLTIRGLVPNIRRIVMPQGLKTLDKIRRASERAERTIVSTASSNVTDAFANIVSAQIKSLTKKIANIEPRYHLPDKT